MTTLKREIDEGLLKLVLCGLDFAPPRGDMGRVGLVWLEAFTRAGFTDDDWERVHVAFADVAPKLQKWPTPKRVIDEVPASPKQFHKSLEHQISDEERQKNIERFEQMKRDCFASIKSTQQRDWDAEWRRTVKRS